MITPQEAESRVFTKASFGGGYNMAQVDAFLDVLLSDYSALYKENAALKSKMKVLAEKLEEYRATEDAMRRTLLSAQKMADSMVKEAEEQKINAIARAETETKSRIDEIDRELKKEETRLAAARNATTVYVNKLKELYTHELEYIGQLAEMTVESGASDPRPNPVKEIEDKVSAMLESAQSEQPAQKEEGIKPADINKNSLYVLPKKDSAAEATPVAESQGAAKEATADTAGEAAQQDEPAEQAEEEHPPRLEESDTVVFDRLQFGKDYEFE